MKAIQIEIVSPHFIGRLAIEPAEADHSLFFVYRDKVFIGHVQPIKTDQGGVVWYSKEITDKELLADIGDWILFHFPVSSDSLRKNGGFRFSLPSFFKKKRPS